MAPELRLPSPMRSFCASGGAMRPGPGRDPVSVCQSCWQSSSAMAVKSNSFSPAIYRAPGSAFPYHFHPHDPACFGYRGSADFIRTRRILLKLAWFCQWRILTSDAEKGNQADYRRDENRCCADGAQGETAIIARLREEIADRGA